MNTMSMYRRQLMQPAPPSDRWQLLQWCVPSCQLSELSRTHAPESPSPLMTIGRELYWRERRQGGERKGERGRRGKRRAVREREDWTFANWIRSNICRVLISTCMIIIFTTSASQGYTLSLTLKLAQITATMLANQFWLQVVVGGIMLTIYNSVGRSHC